MRFYWRSASAAIHDYHLSKYHFPITGTGTIYMVASSHLSRKGYVDEKVSDKTNFKN